MQVSYSQANIIFDTGGLVTITTDDDSVGITWDERDADCLGFICAHWYSEEEQLHFHVNAQTPTSY